MDKKYVGHTIALPVDVADALKTLQVELESQLGFKPSLSETIAFLIRSYRLSLTGGVTDTSRRSAASRPPVPSSDEWQTG